MDEYLDEELESLKQCFDTITKGWDSNVGLIIFIPRALRSPRLSCRIMPTHQQHRMNKLDS